jgi:hypothetical protein
VQISKLGFKTIIKPDVVLNVQSVVALNFILPVGATSESITVEAGSFLLNTTDASVSTVIDRKFVENMPSTKQSPSTGTHCCCEEVAPRYIRDISKRPEV